MSEEWKDIPKEKVKTLKIKFYSELDDQMFRKHPTDAGFDVRTNMGFEIEPGETVPVKTGLHVLIPKGYMGKIEGRSGLALKHQIQVLGGVVDAGYTGEIIVILHRPKEAHGGSVYFQKGNRIAQLCIEKIPDPETELIRVERLEDLGDTDRNENGFGSSGVE